MTLSAGVIELAAEREGPGVVVIAHKLGVNDGWVSEGAGADQNEMRDSPDMTGERDVTGAVGQLE